MGRIAEIGDANSLAEAVLATLRDLANLIADVPGIQKEYDPDRIAVEYENLFTEIAEEINP
jgi:hypothetical protein